MSFFDTLKSMGLLNQQQGGGDQPNPYGLDPAMMRQARMDALGNIGGQLMAISQQMTPDQRARLMANADWSGGYQNNLYNAAQMQLMGNAAKQKQAQSEQDAKAREYILGIIKQNPNDPRAKKAAIYAQLNDWGSAAKTLVNDTEAQAPKTITVREGDMEVTKEWRDGKWQTLSKGLAFKPTPDTVVNNNVGGGADDFDKKLMGGVGDAYVEAMKAGATAQETKTAVMQLRELLGSNSGMAGGFSATVAPYLPEGVIPEGANDLVAANAIIAGLIPRQRVPGAGSTSDYDAKMFAKSLPSVWNKPGANALILNTLDAYADYRISVAEIIADVAADPSIQNKSGAIRDKIKELPDPFSEWKRSSRGLLSAGGAQTTAPGRTSQPSAEVDSALEEYP